MVPSVWCSVGEVDMWARAARPAQRVTRTLPAGGDTVLQSVFVVEPGGAAAWAAVVDMSAAAQVALHPSAVCLE